MRFPFHFHLLLSLNPYLVTRKSQLSLEVHCNPTKAAQFEQSMWCYHFLVFKYSGGILKAPFSSSCLETLKRFSFLF